MSENRVLKVGITQGDINGIGSEVIIKALSDSRMCELVTPVLYGSSKIFAFYRKEIEEGEGFAPHSIASAVDARSRRINLVECVDENVRPEPGQVTSEAGMAAVQALQCAAEDLKNGVIDVLVTAPINKESVQSDAFRFTGHTEFLASVTGGEPLMVMCSDLMRVGLATIHLPVAEVSERITGELIVRRLHQLQKMLIVDFGIVAPKIAVLSLNPHAGDGGLLGGEEDKIIRPAIAEAYAQGVLAFGPFAADGFFAAGNYTRYDAVLAMYHDQGLAPFKALTPYGVNYTASLPVVRTSPDHGVAYDIAGKGLADPASMRQAIFTAVDIWRNRSEYAEMSRNPLRRYERDKGRDVSVADLPQTESDDA